MPNKGRIVVAALAVVLTACPAHQAKTSMSPAPSVSPGNHVSLVVSHCRAVAKSCAEIGERRPYRRPSR